MPEPTNDISIGPYRGLVAEAFNKPDLIDDLGIIASLLSAQTEDSPAVTRNRIFNLALSCDGKPLAVSVKQFGRQNPVKDQYDKAAGSRARRSWSVAHALREANIGTPAPIGFLERWEGARLDESYLLTVQEQNITNFKDELIRLYREDPVCGKIMALMAAVSKVVREMHDAGIMHGDLGNQNILMRRKGDTEWCDIQFVDLNRARVVDELSVRQRAFDISRLSLPSDFLRVFKEMYYMGEVPPRDFQRWEASYRRRFSFHTRTRKFRHPIREYRKARQQSAIDEYPPEKELWIWDERSAQAISPFTSRDRRRFDSLASHLKVVWSAIVSWRPVQQRCNALLEKCFTEPVSMQGRIGVAVEPDPETRDQELKLLERLGRVPVIIRLYHHRAESDTDFRIELVKDLAARGYSVSIALVQDRKAVSDPASWCTFVKRILGEVSDVVDLVEVGHAINRSKWGFWSLAEHRRFIEASAAAAAGYPNVRLTGPAVIDFEYPYLIGALRNMPGGLKFSALSHHLYVDRRGAPENTQAGYSSLDKFAMGRAIAQCAGNCDDRFIVSETNWPLLETGVYSPVGAPYESPGVRVNDPSVSEEDYADYMIRYLLLAICSGMVDRVYWWRLAARGFGLVDDSEEEWRQRPAYDALRTFISVFGKSSFTERRVLAEDTHMYVFSRDDRLSSAVVYTTGDEADVPVDFTWTRMADVCGVDIECEAGSLPVSGSPIYLLGLELV